MVKGRITTEAMSARKQVKKQTKNITPLARPGDL
jgi:hypothetical protein